MGIADSLDLTPNQRKIVVSLLTRYIPSVSVWAYGSRVKWTSRPDSDLDLVVFVTPEKRGRISALKEAFEESSLPFRVDIMVWDEVPENFRKNILEQYLVLVEKPAEKPEKELAVSDWRSSKWGDEISLEYGKALRGYESTSGPYRVYGSNGPVGWTTQYLAAGPGVILGRKGAYRGVQFSKEPFFVIDTAYYVVPKTQLDMRWIYYAIKHYKLGEIDDGSPIPSTTRAAVYMMDLDVPSLQEQHAIANILGTLDDKIELNRKMNETLEAMAQALFKSWFVDFEPVRAKSEGCDTGLPQEIADQFPDSFEDSDFGGVPKGWRVGPLPDFIEVNPQRSLRKDELAPYLDMANVPTNAARADEVVEREFSSGAKFKNGDTLLARITPCLENGKTAYVDFLRDGQVGWGSTEFIVLRPKPPLPPEFGYLLARYEGFRTFAISNMTGTSGRQRVPSDCFNNYVMAVPPQEVAGAFGRHVAAIMKKIKGNDEQSRTLANQRDALLPKLLSGEVRVKDVERIIGAP